MPYSSIADLPATVKDNLPKHAQEIFLAAFNSAFKEHGKEETAFKIAWSAVEKSYEKVDGKWKAIKNTEHVFYFTTSGEFTLSKHDAILQTLDRWIGGYFMNASAFNPSAWDGIPIIYQKEGVHPDLLNFATNPEEELKRINGKQVGINRAPTIDINGHARLTSNLTINDEHVDSLINSRKISLSTGFFGKYDETNKLTATTPNHILLFEEGVVGSAVPVDIGAIILNSKDGGTMAKPTKEDMNKILDFMIENPGSIDKETMDKMWSAIDEAGHKEYLKSMLKDLEEHPEMMDDEMKGMMSNMTVIKNSIKKEIEDIMAEEETKLTDAEKQTQILNSQLKAEVEKTAALELEVKKYREEKEVQIKNTRVAQWEQIKNSLPPGLTHEPEAEKKLQDQFMGDPFAFAVFVANQIKTVTTPQEGSTHQIVNSENDKKAEQGYTVGGVHTTEA